MEGHDDITPKLVRQWISGSYWYRNASNQRLCKERVFSPGTREPCRDFRILP